MYFVPGEITSLIQRRLGRRVLIFNQQGERDAFDLLENLYKTIDGGVVDDSEGSADGVELPKFDHIIFCPTVLGGDSTKNGEFELTTVPLSTA
jgi:hypothetical protein